MPPLLDILRACLRVFRGRPKSLGAIGEAHAAKYLRSKGWRIIARNRKIRGDEVDLIAVDGEFIVFVEVRTRSSEDFMRPEESIQFGGKKRNMRRAVRKLTRRYKVERLTPRIDLVAIVWPAGAKEPTEVRHHRGAVAVATW